MTLLEPILLILSNDEFPALALTVGLAALTILIPVGLALFNPAEEFKRLDTRVILDEVTRSRGILIYIGLIFVPTLFWNGAPHSWRGLELALWTLGLVYLVVILTNAYQWLSGQKYPHRFAYLKDLSDPEALAEAWEAVWINSQLDAVRESQFFELFMEKINELTQ